jgi:hypothetical protein
MWFDTFKNCCVSTRFVSPFSKRIFERLQIEHGFAGGSTVIKDYVRLARTKSR